jgi:hypothetical protein
MDQPRWWRHGWLLAALVCLPALIPTLQPGWFEGHDDLHIFRLVQFDAALRDGQVPPRWYPDVSAGFGNPHPLYYAPLFYMAAEAAHLAGLGVISSLKAALALFTILAAVGMYRYARLFWSAPAALVAAAAYTYAPYHLLDIYVRKAFSEYTVFAILPFLLEACHRLRFRGTRWDMIRGAWWLAAMFTAHTISTMLVPPLLAAYALLLSRLPDTAGAISGRPRQSARRRWSWKWLAPAAVSSALGAMLACFFLLPAFVERDAINLEVYTENYMDFHKHFVHPLQVVWWPWGFGMSQPGLDDGISFRLGLAQIAGVLLAAAGLRRLRASDGRPHAGFFLGLTGAGLFFMLPLSLPIWEALPSMRFVQFPWRFLTLTTIGSGFLCGAAFAAWGPGGAREGISPRAARRTWIACAGVCAALAGGAVAGGLLDVNLRVPADRVGFEEKPYNNMVDRGRGASPEPFDRAFVARHTLHWIDHLPVGARSMGLRPEDVSRPRVEVIKGPARVEQIRGGTWWHAAHAVADAPAVLRVNVHRFPGWTVRVDGKEVPLRAVQGRPVLAFDLPAGAHEVSATFEGTPARRLGDALTLAGLAGIALVALWPERRAGS